MTRTTGPCYCDGMFLRGSKHSFVPRTVSYVSSVKPTTTSLSPVKYVHTVEDEG